MKKMHGYKYANSIVGLSVDESKIKYYAICDGCGRKMRTDYGLEIHLNSPRVSMNVKRCYCGKCMKTMEAILLLAIDSLDREHKKIESKYERVHDERFGGLIMRKVRKQDNE